MAGRLAVIGTDVDGTVTAVGPVYNEHSAGEIRGMMIRHGWAVPADGLDQVTVPGGTMRFMSWAELRTHVAARSGRRS